MRTTVGFDPLIHSSQEALLTTRRLKLLDTRTTGFEVFFKNKSKHSNQCSVEAVGQTRLASHRFLQRCCPQVLVGKGFAAMVLRHYSKGRCRCYPCLEASRCEWRKSRGMDPFILLRAALNKRAHRFRRTYFGHMAEIGPIALHCTTLHQERRELWLASAAIRRWRTHQNHGNKLRHRTPVLIASICRSNWVPSSRQRQPRLPLWR